MKIFEIITLIIQFISQSIYHQIYIQITKFEDTWFSLEKI